MRHLLLSVAALTLVVGLLTLKPITTDTRAQAQTEEEEAGGQASMTTSWGEPNLQGIWTHDVELPLQRPEWVEGREFFTDEELTALDDQRAAWLDHDYRAERGTPADVAGAYNAVYHLRKPTGRRTSLIVDPPDGQLPEEMPAVGERDRVWREYQLAVLQATPACRDNERSCRGGTYGLPSPRFDEPAPIYPLGGVNRSSGPEDHGLLVRCLAGYMPAGGERAGFSSGGNGFTRRIVQSPGGIAMYYDTGQGQSWQRPTIVMNGSPHLPSHIRGWWGDSRGTWEGETLVIDVTNFTPKTDIFGARENLHLVERFTRTGPKTLEYLVTFDDPTTWTKPWTVKVEYTRQDDFSNRVYTDNRCHEGNYGLPALLRGARAEDRAYAEGRGPNPATICQNSCGAGNADAEPDPRQRRDDFRNPFE